MGTGRLEAFSDGVIAIIITIMVLELKVPHEHDLAALKPLVPVLLNYLLSFVYVGIYWNNHHHMLHATKEVNGAILWSNLHLLFWLSLIPFVTSWMGDNHFAKVPTAMYGVVLFMASIAFLILQFTIVSKQGKRTVLAKTLSNDRKGRWSPVLYAAAIGLAFVSQWIADSIYIAVALMWLIPDRRIEKAVASEAAAEGDSTG